MFCYASIIILWCGVICTVNGITSLPITPLTDHITNITIDLSSYDKLNTTTHSFVKYLDLSRNNCSINIHVNASSTPSFFVIQFHSFKAKFNLTNESNETVIGKDTGLVQVDWQQGVVYSYRLSCVQEPEGNVKVLVAVVVYENEDPIPGGCNLTFRPEISAYQNVTFSDSVVQVDVQAASYINSTCGNNTVSLEMYHLYLRQHTLDENEYFEGITKMLTYDGIMNNAYKVPRPDGVLPGRRFYSAYLGTGTIYAVIARYNDRFSVYVPAVSYACDIDNWDDNCIAPTSTIWRIINAILIFLGCFALYAGHCCFKPQVFITGFVLGFFGGYVLSGISANYTAGESVSIATVLGLVTGLAWIALWWRFGLPIVSASLCAFLASSSVLCVIFYSSVGDYEYSRRNLNYWGMFLCGIVVSSIPLMACTKFMHIFACSFLGATAITVSINHYAGGNLHYVFINNYRRATVAGFEKAVIDPVFQYTDVLLTVMWLALLLSGLIIQTKLNRGRAPFPSQMQINVFCIIARSMNRNIIGQPNFVSRNAEHSPLIGERGFPTYS